jgi:tellurite resistance protein
LCVCSWLLQKQHRGRTADQARKFPASDFFAAFVKAIVLHCVRSGTVPSRFRNELSAGISASRGKNFVACPLLRVAPMKSTTLKVVALALFTALLASCATTQPVTTAQKKENQSGLASVLR